MEKIGENEITNTDTQKLIEQDQSLEWLNKRFEALSLQNQINKVGFCFDERMLSHKDFSNSHVECPERAMSIYMNLINKGYKEKLSRINVSEISEELILKVHTPEYLKKLKDLENEAKYAEETGYRMCYDTFDNIYTYKASLLSAGGLINCCKAILKGDINSCFAIIRPPGHHSFSEKCSGFCFLNNIAIAAKYLLGKTVTTTVNNNSNNITTINREKTIERIAIVDWDVHHGNGTQEIFYGDNKIIYISLHRYDNGQFYPFSKAANYTQIGKGIGEGYNINIPWNTKHKLFSFKSSDCTGVYDEEYIAAFELIIKPILKEFKPDFILVSSGFDAAENDPLGKLNLTPFCYYYMTRELKAICGEVAIALEGGYNLTSLATCSEGVFRALLDLDHRGMDFYDESYKQLIEKKETDCTSIILSYLEPNKLFIDDLLNFRKLFSKYWKTLELKNSSDLNPNNDLLVQKLLIGSSEGVLSKGKKTIEEAEELEKLSEYLMITIHSFDEDCLKKLIAKRRKDDTSDLSIEKNISKENEDDYFRTLSLIRFLKKTTGFNKHYRISAAKTDFLKFENESYSQNFSEQDNYSILTKFLSNSKLNKDSLICCFSNLLKDLLGNANQDDKVDFNEAEPIICKKIEDNVGKVDINIDIIIYPIAISKSSNDNKAEEESINSIKSKLRSHEKKDIRLKCKIVNSSEKEKINISNKETLVNILKAVIKDFQENLLL